MVILNQVSQLVYFYCISIRSENYNLAEEVSFECVSVLSLPAEHHIRVRLAVLFHLKKLC